MQIRNPMHGIVLADQPVLVPGIGLYTEAGEPHDRGMARVEVIANSFSKGITIPELYLTGGKANEHRASEADVIEYEIYQRVGEELLRRTTIVKETSSTNSLQNFVNVADDLASQRPDALSLVTDWAHMPRMLTIARKIVHSTTDLVPVIAQYRPSLYEVAREIPALPVTAATLFGINAGNADELNSRVQKYMAAKQKVNAALHR